MEESELKITVEPAGMRLLRLTVEVPEEQVEQEMRRTARQIAREVTIPGFRKGKAPYNIIIQRYGEDAVRREAADALAERVYRAALEGEEIAPYAPATLVEVELAPMRFAFDVPLPPVVELGDYRSLRIKSPAVRVTEKEVAEVLERLRQENAVLEPVEGRPAQVGDILVISIEGRAEDGAVFLRQEEAEVLLDPEDERPAPGFYRSLEGMRVGEERAFRLKMPEGRPSDEAEFTVRLLRLLERILPDLDDDLARTVGNFDNLKELKKEVKDQIRRRKQQGAEEEYTKRVVQAVVEQARVEYPPDLLDEVVDDLVEEVEARVRQETRMSLPDYLKAIGKDQEQLRQELRLQAEERLRYSLVLAEVADVEGLQVSDGEVEQRITDISRSWNDRADEVRERLQTAENRQMLLNDLLTEKVIERLVTFARGEMESEEG